MGTKKKKLQKLIIELSILLRPKNESEKISKACCHLLEDNLGILLDFPLVYPVVAAKVSRFYEHCSLKLRDHLIELNQNYINLIGCDCGEKVCFYQPTDAGCYPYSYDYFYKHFTHPVFYKSCFLHYPKPLRLQLVNGITKLLTNSSNEMGSGERMQWVLRDRLVAFFEENDSMLF
jgi:hypothetical protein